MTNDEIEAKLRDFWNLDEDDAVEAADAIAHLRAEVERMTRERDNIMASFEAERRIKHAEFARAEAAERQVATLREAMNWINFYAEIGHPDVSIILARIDAALAETEKNEPDGHRDLPGRRSNAGSSHDTTGESGTGGSGSEGTTSAADGGE